MRARRAANPEAVAEANRKWRRENPERAALTSRLKKQRRRAAGVLTIADWQGVLALYGSDCLSCGSDDPPTIDHVVPIIQGGSNTVDNVQPLCRTCNTRKGRKTIDYRPQLVAAV
jgi:5-methylcytosine-specific restriction endonuclease McrA